MTSDHNTQHPHSFSLSPKIPKFFKIILQDTIQEGRLGIPKKFVKKYRNSLRGHVILRVGNGRKWKMELSEDENNSNEVWIEKGWKEFLKHYSIKNGYLAVFEWEEASNFKVFIFDTTLVEIEYYNNMEPNHHSHFQGKWKEPKVEHRKKKNIHSNYKHSKSSNYSKAIEAAEKLRSTNPTFKVVLRCNPEGRIPAMTVPYGFIKQQMECKTQRIMVRVEDKKWGIKMNVYEKKGRAALSAGWAAFARENSLKNGDVCVFELIQPNTFYLHIFRHLL